MSSKIIHNNRNSYSTGFLTDESDLAVAPTSQARSCARATVRWIVKPLDESLHCCWERRALFGSCYWLDSSPPTCFMSLDHGRCSGTTTAMKKAQWNGEAERAESEPWALLGLLHYMNASLTPEYVRLSLTNMLWETAVANQQKMLQRVWFQMLEIKDAFDNVVCCDLLWSLLRRCRKLNWLSRLK